MKAAGFAAFFVLFSVALASASCTPLSGDRLSNIRTATDETGKTPTGVYTPLQTFCVLADVQGIQPGSTVEAKWIAVDAKGVVPNTQINTSDYVYKQGVAHIYFKLATWDKSSWPAGSYKVILLLNGIQSGEQTFSVQ